MRAPDHPRSAGQRRRPLDTRLLIPALTAWVVLAVTLTWRPALQFGLAGGFALLAAIGWLLERGRRRESREGPADNYHDDCNDNDCNDDDHHDDCNDCTVPAAVAAPSGGSVRMTVVLAAVCTAAVMATAGAQSVTREAGPIRELAQIRGAVQISGVATSEPRIIERLDAEPLVVLRIRVDHVVARGQVAAVSTPVVVFADLDWADLRWRSEFTATGRLGPTDAGSDSVASFSPSGAPSTRGHPGGVFAAADVARERLRQAVDPLPADARGLIPGLVIGDTALTPPELTEAMLLTGMTHLSAVSGSNVAIVVGAVILACGWCGVPRRWRPPVAVVAIVGFVILCRPEPSVLRAGTMGIIGLLALSTNRRHASLPALAAAILILLGIDPFHARSYGFVLSCLATLGLVVFARPWGEAMARRLPRGFGWLGYAVAIPLSAQVMCGPVIVLLQSAVQPVAILANLLAAPLVAPTTIAGILAAVGATIWPPLGLAFAWVGAGPAWLLGRIARAGAMVPAGSIDWLPGPAGAWLLAVITAAVVLSGPWLAWQSLRRPWASAAAVVLLVAAASPLPSPLRPDHAWSIAGCDVGQGDGFVVKAGATSAVVIDTGPDPGLMASCLRDLGVDQVEALVLTHFHSDHIGGLDGVLEVATVHRAYVSPVRDPPAAAMAVQTVLAEAGVEVIEVTAGQWWQWGEVSARVVWPRERVVSVGSVANNNSIVLDLRVSGVRALFLADIEWAAAGAVRRELQGERFDVVKIAHHGSADQDHELIRGLGARVALIGVGADNTFGHPAPSVVALLEDLDMVVLRTDRHGQIHLGVDEIGALTVLVESGP